MFSGLHGKGRTGLLITITNVFTVTELVHWGFSREATASLDLSHKDRCEKRYS